MRELEALYGSIEIDKVYVNGQKDNKHDNNRLKFSGGKDAKTMVLGMRERGGRMKAMPITDITKQTLHPIIYENIIVGSTIHTDSNTSYVRQLPTRRTGRD